MGLQTIEKLQTMSDPLKAFMFTMVLSETKGGKINAENFELQCQSYTFPGTNMSTTQVQLGGWKRTDAALQDRSGEWTTKVIETWDATIYDEFESWMNIMHDVEAGTISSATEYKTSAVVNMVNGAGTPMKSRKLRGLFPKSISSTEYSPSSSDAVSVSITWSYDFWK